jgi:hypothetical protein
VDVGKERWMDGEERVRMDGELGGRNGLCGRTGRWIGFKEIGMGVFLRRR